MPLNERLRKDWKAAGYEHGHASDAVLPPARPGHKRLYYLTGADHAISNIVFGRVKVSRLAELNDPFELLGQNFSDANVRKSVREHKNAMNEKLGIVCFSEDWVDPVLWSHYASKHKGVALGFDAEQSTVRQVSYSSKRLRQISSATIKRITDDVADALITTKYESWSYEREWRLTTELSAAEKEGGLYFINFGTKLRLVEVILGALCDLNLRKIRSLVDKNHPDVMTYSARLALRSFRIIPKGSTVVLPTLSTPKIIARRVGHAG